MPPLRQRFISLFFDAFGCFVISGSAICPNFALKAAARFHLLSLTSFHVLNACVLTTYPSKLLENAVNELSRLPGIGRKTSLRLCLHLLGQPENVARNLGEAVIRMRSETRYCTRCHNISDLAVCGICSDPRRDVGVVCVVESTRDIMAIENTGQFRGLFHVLGGKISPFEGKGPDDLTIASLVERAAEGNIREVVFALPANMEGDTTSYYIYRRLQEFGLKFTSIARGVAVGDELEYTDEVTLGRSILNRMPYETAYNKV